MRSGTDQHHNSAPQSSCFSDLNRWILIGVARTDFHCADF
jgi:hypothetical protein